MNSAPNKQQTAKVTSNDQATISPDVNIYETKEAFVLEAEMAGVNKEGLEITLDENVLTFVGRRHDTPPSDRVVYRESQDVNYRRVFELDPSIDSSKITARMELGVLTLTLPKVERAQPRKINVA